MAEPTSRRAPTMADVAAGAGVSRALVSTVFRGVPGASPATRERVLRVAAELGFRPDNRARLLRQVRTRLLGVTFQVRDVFHADLVVELYRAAAAADYHLTLSGVTDERDQQAATQALLDERCEALLMLSPDADPQWLTEQGTRTPVVVLSRSVGASGVDLVRCHDDEVVALALDHLLGLGHRHIWHLDGGAAEGTGVRRRSFHRLMSEHGLGARARSLRGGRSEADGAAAVGALVADPDPPTALVAYNDRSAVGAVFALRRAGLRVPGDVSVVGFDDVQMAALPHVDLTTIGQNARETAEQAVRRAVARLDRQADPGHDIRVSPYLVVRGTTAAPRDRAIVRTF